MEQLLDSFIFVSLVKAAVIFAVLMTTLAYLQWVERKVIAHIQVRPGPYRVGPHGLLQPLADVIKLITKEDALDEFLAARSKYVPSLKQFRRAMQQLRDHEASLT